MRHNQIQWCRRCLVLSGLAEPWLALLARVARASWVTDICVYLATPDTNKVRFQTSLPPALGFVARPAGPCSITSTAQWGCCFYSTAAVPRYRCLQGAAQHIKQGCAWAVRLTWVSPRLEKVGVVWSCKERDICVRMRARRLREVCFVLLLVDLG
jgi:hypothetical protein